MGWIAFSGHAAFEDLDFEPFRAHFADDACAFFPGPRVERACGREEIEATFRKVFEAERQAGTSGPPYLHLDPEDLRIQLLGPDVAVATFHLRNAERVARRTFVFVRRGDRWLIVNLHASNIPVAR